MATSALLQPLDVIRTNLQVPSSSLVPQPSRHTPIRTMFLTIVRRDGVAGLWRGTGPTCIRVGLGAGVYFSLLDQILSILRSSQPIGGGQGSREGQLSASSIVLAGALTRGIAATLLCPITVVKTRMEYAGTTGSPYRGTFQAVYTIARVEGLRGLFSGIGPTLLRDAPYSGLYLLFYSRLRLSLRENLFPEESQQTVVNLLSGGIAGATSTIITHPPDVVRTTLQLNDSRNQNVWEATKRIMGAHGVGGFYRGVIPRMAKRALQQAITWTLFEEVSRKLGNISIWGGSTSAPP